jgi:two-component system, chemotaxis family, chemotaxis protein CheV
MVMANKQEILMEAGTNELEILVFGIGNERFGINVAKIREVVRIPIVIKPPNANPMVEGVINLREQVIPLISLRKALGYPKKDVDNKERVIISEYHKQWFGFIVDDVDTIVRLSWKSIEPPPHLHQHSKALTGVAHVNEKLVLMLDVETLTQPLLEGKFCGDEQEDDPRLVPLRETKKILTADDSGMIRTLVNNILTRAGYKDIAITLNGEEAWDYLQQNPHIDLVVTDIEMPQMDGLRLTKLIKTDDRLSHIPVIVFSSIISDDNRNKGEQVGADDQISKPEIERLVQTVDRLLNIDI